MHWFKICLLVYFGLTIIVKLWSLKNPKENKAIHLGVGIIINLLCLLGTYLLI